MTRGDICVVATGIENVLEIIYLCAGVIFSYVFFPGNLEVNGNFPWLRNIFGDKVTIGKDLVWGQG